MNPLLKLAVMGGVVSAIRMLLDRGADVNEQDKTGATLLIHAASRGQIEICRLLLSAGADPSKQDFEGRDAIKFAEIGGHNSIADELRSFIRASAEPISSETHVFESLVGVDEFEPNLDAWTADNETMPPQEDPTIRSSTLNLTSQFINHTPLGLDTLWNDVEVALPEFDFIWSAGDLFDEDYVTSQ